jgi:hypothetical protein
MLQLSRQQLNQRTRPLNQPDRSAPIRSDEWLDPYQPLATD